MKKAVFALHLFALLGIFVISAFSQTAQLTGTVTDQSASVVPGTRVTATNTDTGVARSTVSNDRGNYLITALLPGTYRITTVAAGFKQVAEGPIILEVDQVARLDFSLQVGEARETVEVQATAVLLDAATSTIGSVVENRQILELPLNGRDPVDLLALSAGIRIQAGFGGVMTSGGTTQGNAWSGQTAASRE
ncbi:MAG TPA: carboxypeptidase-like regulatory domain-containing protein [Candidatus Acidoferrales bacterium]|nr:carboxypeptidase-like regulatory domain-containing protein [Candidatus Acidoferrales bacterium]